MSFGRVLVWSPTVKFAAAPLTAAGAVFSEALTAIAAATGCVGLAAACAGVGVAGIAAAAVASVASLSLLSLDLPPVEGVFVTDAGGLVRWTVAGFAFTGAGVPELFVVTVAVTAPLVVLFVVVVVVAVVVAMAWRFPPLAAFAFAGTFCADLGATSPPVAVRMLEVALAFALGLLPFVPAGVLAPAACAEALAPAVCAEALAPAVRAEALAPVVRAGVSEPALGPDRVLTAVGGFGAGLGELELDAAPALRVGWAADEPEF